MIYYSILYMKNGEIHLKPHSSPEAAQKTINGLLDSKWGPAIDKAKVLTKDESRTRFKESKGYWVA